MPSVTWRQGWSGAGCALLLAACIDDRNPGVLESSPGAGAGPSGDTLGLRGTPMGAGGSAGTMSSGGATPAANGARAAPAREENAPGGNLGSTPPASDGSMPPPSDGSTPGASPAPTGMLGSNGSSFDFGVLEVGVGSSNFTWRIENLGAVPTGTLALLFGTSEGFQVKSGCPEYLPAGAYCNIDVTFAPTVGGSVAADIQFGQANQVVSLAVTGNGRYRLGVQRSGQGELTVNGLPCADSCSSLFDPGPVTLSARTQNGSNSLFTGWSIPECAANDDCVLDLDRSRSITATFQEQSGNLIFVTSSSYPTNVGGFAVLDAECNRLASAAGINSAAGNDFIAAVSDSRTSLRQRLAGARGWVRRDGLPFADSIEALFDQYQVLYSPWLTEHGALNDKLPMTGTDQQGGSTAENCNNWTSLDGSVLWRSGRAEGGPRSAISYANIPCGMPAPVYCMGTRRSSPVALTSASGKRIWLTRDAYTPGSMTPDEFCQSTRPAGVARGVAFVAYTTRPAAAVLDPEALYVRLDGAIVGTGADLADGRVLAGPWLSEYGMAEGVSGGTWGGAATPRDLADPNFNCNDWQSASSSVNGDSGELDVSSPLFFYDFAYSYCSDPRQVRCVEP